MREYWQFVRQHAPLLLFGFCCIFWGNFGQSFFLGWYGDVIKRDLQLSAQAYGAIYSGATLCSAAVLVWLGSLIDRWRVQSYLVLVALGFFIACGLMASAAGLLTLGLGLFFLRLFGQGLFPHMGATLMAREFQQHRGKAISLAGSGVPVGEVVLPGLAVFMIASIGWQWSWWAVGLATLLFMLPVSLMLLRRSRTFADPVAIAEAAGPGEGRAKRAGGLRVLGSDRRFWLAAPTLVASPFMLTAFFIHQDFVLAEKNWSDSWLASSFVIYGVVHWMSAIAAGLLVDRYTGRRLISFYAIPLILAIFLIANVQGGWVAPAVMALFGLTQGASAPVCGSVWAEVYGVAIIGGVRSAVGAFMVLSTAVSPVVFGVLIDESWSLAWIYNLFGLLFLISLGLLRFSYGRHITPRNPEHP